MVLLKRSTVQRFLSSGLPWLLVLACLNLFLTTKLNHVGTIDDKSRNLQQSINTSTAARVINASLQKVPKRIQTETRTFTENIFEHINLTSQGRWDESRKFRIFEHAFTGEKFANLSLEYNVTLVTQSSLNKLHWISQVKNKNFHTTSNNEKHFNLTPY